MKQDTLILTRAPAGILIVGPEGFPDIVLEKTIAVLAEVRNRVNYLMPSPVVDPTEEERKIIPFPAQK